MIEKIPFDASVVILTHLDLIANSLGSGHLKNITKNVSFIELYSREREEFIEIPRKRLQKRINRYFFRSGRGEEFEGFSGTLLKILNYSRDYNSCVRVLFGDKNSFVEEGDIALYQFYGRLNEKGNKVIFDNLGLFYY